MKYTRDKSNLLNNSFHLRVIKNCHLLGDLEFALENGSEVKRLGHIWKS